MRENATPASSVRGPAMSSDSASGRSKGTLVVANMIGMRVRPNPTNGKLSEELEVVR